MRRATLQSTSQISRPKLGRPLKIYTEIANAGKTIPGSKLRIRWKFGWTEGAGEHEVELLYSTVSGKKVRSFEGRRVILLLFLYYFPCISLLSISI